MTHKAWSSIEEVSYCFSRSSVKLQGHTQQKIADFDRIELFRTVTQVWIHRWIWNDAQILTQYRRGTLLFFKVIHQISMSHGTKNADFFSPSLNSPMVLKRCTKLDMIWMGCTIEYQGHPSNFKVTQDNKSPILTQIERFRTITPVWIHRWIWNDTQSLVWWRRAALLLFMSSKFQAHSGWKIDDLNPIWLLGRSQLSNPSDSPYFTAIGICNDFTIDNNVFLNSMSISTLVCTRVCSEGKNIPSGQKAHLCLG